MSAPSNTEPGADTYEARKISGRCTRCGQPAADDSLLCAPHRDDARAAVRKSKAKSRRARRRQRRCVDCNQRSRTYRCTACQIRVNRLRVNNGANKRVDTKRERIAAATKISTNKSEGGRVRYHGQGKRGRQSGAQLDEQDLRDARKDLEAGTEALGHCQTPAVKTLPKIQRDDVERAALGRLASAGRWIDEVLVRHHYERVEIGPSDEKDED